MRPYTLFLKCPATLAGEKACKAGVTHAVFLTQASSGFKRIEKCNGIIKDGFTRRILTRNLSKSDFILPHLNGKSMV